jgi:hypothetical protein
MAFTFDCATWSSACSTLANLGIRYVMAGGPVVPSPPPGSSPSPAPAPSPAPSPSPPKFDGRFLLLSNPGFAFAEFLEKALTDSGVAFDRVNVDAKVVPKVNLATTLWNADGTPKYKAFAM